MLESVLDNRNFERYEEKSENFYFNVSFLAWMKTHMEVKYRVIETIRVNSNFERTHFIRMISSYFDYSGIENLKII